MDIHLSQRADLFECRNPTRVFSTTYFSGAGVRQAEYALGTVVPALLKGNKSWKPGDIALLYRSLNEGTLIAARPQTPWTSATSGWIMVHLSNAPV